MLAVKKTSTLGTPVIDFKEITSQLPIHHPSRNIVLAMAAVATLVGAGLVISGNPFPFSEAAGESSVAPQQLPSRPASLRVAQDSLSVTDTQILDLIHTAGMAYNELNDPAFFTLISHFLKTNITVWDKNASADVFEAMKKNGMADAIYHALDIFAWATTTPEGIPAVQEYFGLYKTGEYDGDTRSKLDAGLKNNFDAVINALTLIRNTPTAKDIVSDTANAAFQTLATSGTQVSTTRKSPETVDLSILRRIAELENDAARPLQEAGTTAFSSVVPKMPPKSIPKAPVAATSPEVSSTNYTVGMEALSLQDVLSDIQSLSENTSFILSSDGSHGKTNVHGIVMSFERNGNSLNTHYNGNTNVSLGDIVFTLIPDDITGGEEYYVVGKVVSITNGGLAQYNPETSILTPGELGPYIKAMSNM